MATQSQPMFLHWVKYAFQEHGHFSLQTSKFEDDENWTFVEERELAFEVPDNFDPRGLQIAGLMALLEKTRAENLVKENKIQDKLNKLLALSMDDSDEPKEAQIYKFGAGPTTGRVRSDDDIPF